MEDLRSSILAGVRTLKEIGDYLEYDDEKLVAQSEDKIYQEVTGYSRIGKVNSDVLLESFLKALASTKHKIGNFKEVRNAVSKLTGEPLVSSPKTKFELNG